MDDPNELMKVSDVAKVLNMTPEYVRRSLLVPNGGKLPAIQVGRHYRVKRSDLQAFLEERYHIRKTRPAGV